MKRFKWEEIESQHTLSGVEKYGYLIFVSKNGHDDLDGQRLVMYSLPGSKTGFRILANFGMKDLEKAKRVGENWLINVLSMRLEQEI
jgi:hypothetical protein